MTPRQITLAQWDQQYAVACVNAPAAPSYMGPLGRHVQAGDLRLPCLLYDNSHAALRLWNFLLTEEDRLRAHRAAGRRIVGAMKDLGTVPVMAFSLPQLAAFYPDGAWWVPCIMQMSSGDLAIADRLGIDESFCPVRAMIGAFVQDRHFPRPDLLVCSVGATCDDFSAIAQRLERLGQPILWWEAPHRRAPQGSEEGVPLPGGCIAPRTQVDFVQGELDRVRQSLSQLAGEALGDGHLAAGIAHANGFRRQLDDLRQAVYTAPLCPMGSLEMLIAEMLAIHFCSDRDEAPAVIAELQAEVRQRVAAGAGYLPGAAKVFWVNPVADLRAMNLLEQCGGRLCGTEFLFSHAMDPIPQDCPPLEALARTALADPMVGPAAQRADRICRDAVRFGAEAVVISRIPGASHCSSEAAAIAVAVRDRLALPVIEIEVPPVIDALAENLRTRLEALVELVRARRQ